MNSKCKECELPENIAESGAFETENITFNEWKQVDHRAQKVSISIDVKDVSSRFNTYVKTLKRHIHVKRIQLTAFNNLLISYNSNKLIIAKSMFKIKPKSKLRTSGKSHFRYLLLAAILISMESS